MIDLVQPALSARRWVVRLLVLAVLAACGAPAETPVPAAADRTAAAPATPRTSPTPSPRPRPSATPPPPQPTPPQPTREPRPEIPADFDVNLLWQQEIPDMQPTVEESDISFLLGGSDVIRLYLKQKSLVRGTISITFFWTPEEAQQSVQRYNEILARQDGTANLPTLAVGDLGYLDRSPNPRQVVLVAQCRTGIIVELDPDYADDLVPLATAISARIAAKCPF